MQAAVPKDKGVDAVDEVQGREIQHLKALVDQKSSDVLRLQHEVEA